MSDEHLGNKTRLGLDRAMFDPGPASTAKVPRDRGGRSAPALRLRPALTWVAVLSIFGALTTATAATAAGAPANKAVAITAATTTAVSANPTVSTLGTRVTYSATVSSPTFGGFPTGTVHFTTGSTELCAATVRLTRNVMSVATCSTINTPAGARKVIAAYSGDHVYTPSSGSTIVKVKVPTTTSGFAERTDYRYVGGEETYYGTVQPSASTSTYPSGRLTFTMGATSLCTATRQYTMDGASHYSCQIHPPIMGFHTVHVVYSGDINFAPSSADFDVRDPSGP